VSQDGVIDVGTGARGARFRLDGGRPAWALTAPGGEAQASLPAPIPEDLASNVPVADASRVAIAYLSTLAETGRTTWDVYDAMRPDFTIGGVEMYATNPAYGGTLRLREIVYLLDPETGEPLTSSSRPRIVGILGDGEPDKIAWSIGVDGIGPDDLDTASVSIAIDGVASDAYLPTDGEQLTEDTYRIEGKLQLPRDLHEGDSLQVDAVAQLAEGGVSRQTLNLTVAADDVGSVWEGEVTARTTGKDSVYPDLDATVTFTRVESSNPSPKYVRFSLTGGTFSWNLHGSDAHCRIDGGPVVVELEPDEYSEIIFDLTGEAGRGITYSGSASLESGPEISVAQSCDNGDYPYATRADGTFWLAPPSEGRELTGDTMSGTYSTGGQIPTVFDWTLHRVK
jgi:hypothetical protein